MSHIWGKDHNINFDNDHVDLVPDNSNINLSRWKDLHAPDNFQWDPFDKGSQNDGSVSAYFDLIDSGQGNERDGTSAWMEFDWIFPWKATRDCSADVTIPLNLDGHYLAYADDGWSDSQQVKLHMFLNATMSYNSNPSGTQVTLSNQDLIGPIDAQNIDIQSQLIKLGTDQFASFPSTKFEIPRGTEITITVTIRLEAYARGGNTHLQVNFAERDGHYIQIPHILLSLGQF